jgi:hypothetical protein
MYSSIAARPANVILDKKTMATFPYLQVPTAGSSIEDVSDFWDGENFVWHVSLGSSEGPLCLLFPPL